VARVRDAGRPLNRMRLPAGERSPSANS
jgi:hypothetical protein